jgi:hypothetical protein
MINPDDISLDSISKMFEYEKNCREVDECDDINELRLMLKSSIKLFLKQQEMVSKLGFKSI